MFLNMKFLALSSSIIQQNCNIDSGWEAPVPFTLGESEAASNCKIIYLLFELLFSCFFQRRSFTVKRKSLVTKIKKS